MSFWLIMPFGLPIVALGLFLRSAWNVVKPPLARRGGVVVAERSRRVEVFYTLVFLCIFALCCYALFMFAFQ
jgi:hypothetical protein